MSKGVHGALHTMSTEKEHESHTSCGDDEGRKSQREFPREEFTGSNAGGAQRWAIRVAQ